MRIVPAGMAAAIAAGATTFCHCWRLDRRDGFSIGFTDHDRDLAFDGVTFRAGSGLEGSDAEAVLGLAVAGADIKGVLRADAITEEDIAAGLWDAAAIGVWRVDWHNPAEHVLLSRGVVGEIRRTDHGFTVEMRSLTQALDQPRGRLYQARCNADLGDARCTVDLANPAYRAEAAITGGDGRLTITTDGLGAYADGLFAGGRLTFTSGANQGAAVEVKQHRLTDGLATIGLWAPLPAALAPGDAFTIAAGCDKAFTTCRDRFANLVNFRGFPFMPGNDFALGYIRTGEPGLDGGSLNR